MNASIKVGEGKLLQMEQLCHDFPWIKPQLSATVQWLKGTRRTFLLRNFPPRQGRRLLPYLAPTSSSAGSDQLSFWGSCICQVWHSECRCPRCLQTAAPPAPLNICSPVPAAAFHCCQRKKKHRKSHIHDFFFATVQSGHLQALDKNPKIQLLVGVMSERIQISPKYWGVHSGFCIFLFI